MHPLRQGANRTISLLLRVKGAEFAQIVYRLSRIERVVALLDGWRKLSCSRHRVGGRKGAGILMRCNQWI